MILALYIAGGITLVISIIGAFLSGSIPAFFGLILAGFASSMIPFGLAHILENQYNILYRLDSQEKIQKKFIKVDLKLCSKCNQQYEHDFTSCPYCGYKE